MIRSWLVERKKLLWLKIVWLAQQRSKSGQQITQTHLSPFPRLTHFCHIIRSTAGNTKNKREKIPLPPSKNHFVEKSMLWRLNVRPASAEASDGFDRLSSGHLIGVVGPPLSPKRRPSSKTKSYYVSSKAKLAFEVFFISAFQKKIVFLDKFFSNVKKRLFAKLSFIVKVFKLIDIALFQRL